MASGVCGLLLVLTAAQALGDEDLSASTGQLVEAERRGAYASDIVEPALAVAASFQSAGEHAAAIPYLRRAIHLLRIDLGLDTVSQIPLLERLLESQRQLDAPLDVDATQRRLYALRLQDADSAAGRLAAVQRYVEWHQERYASGQSGRPYLHLLEMYGAHAAEIDRLESSDAEDVSLIPHLYGQLAVEYLVSGYQEGGDSPSIQLHAGSGLHAGMTDLAGERFRLMRRDNYRNGRTTAERIVEILDSQPDTDSAAIAAAWIALGDWHMWWNSPALAIDSYRRAWQRYATDGDPATDPESLFDSPIVLPVQQTFGQRDSSADRPRHAEARVRFTVSRLGEVRAVQVMEVASSHEDGADIVLQRMLRGARFRPVFEAGDAVAAPGIERTFSISY